MPKRLKINPNERIDLPDFLRSSSEFTEEQSAFELERAWLDKRSRLLEGFRVEISDQTSNPGEITVYNGNALARDGKHLNSEDQVADARTIVLAGAGAEFFIELEFALEDTDQDARGFWDPTVDNTDPTPDGEEFVINTTTREFPTWKVIVSGAFESETDLNSIRIPLMRLKTDGDNGRILAGGDNPGLVSVFAASVLEEDASISDTRIRVLDSRLFTVGDDVFVDLGDASQEGVAPVLTLLDNDRTNGILTLSSALVSAHTAGAIIRLASGSADIIQDRIAAKPDAVPSTTTTHPDQSRRFWQGDEVRGSSLVSSKETFGGRDDLNIRNLKDAYDALTAEVRELKFGSLRSDVTSAAPPIDFSSTRWFDPAGSVTGARTNTVSIGDGISTFGDFNGTTDATFTAAIAALPASGGIIFVKNGVYAFSSTVALSKPVTLVGETRASTVIQNAVAASFAFEITAASSRFDFANLTMVQTTGGPEVLNIDGTLNTVRFENAAIAGGVVVSASILVYMHALNCTFTTSTGTSCVYLPASSVISNGSFVQSIFTTTSAPVFSGAVVASLFDSCELSSDELTLSFESAFDLHIRKCRFLGSPISGVTIQGASDNVYISECITAATTTFVEVFAATDRLSVHNCVTSGDSFLTATSEITLLSLRDCAIESTGLSGGGKVITLSSVNGGKIDNCSFTTNFAGTSPVTPGEIIELTGDLSGVSISGCSFENTGATTHTHGLHLANITDLDGVHIESCYFKGLRAGVFTTSVADATSSISISDCAFDGNSLAIDQYGVRQDESENRYILKVSGCVFDGYSGAGEKIGIRIRDSVNTLSIVNIVGNRIFVGGGSSSPLAAGIYGTTSSPTLGVLGVVSNNYIVASGLTAYGTFLDTNGILINNNLIEATAAGTGTPCSGVRLTSNCTCNSNRITARSNFSNPVVRGVELAGSTLSSKVSINGNYFKLTGGTDVGSAGIGLTAPAFSQLSINDNEFDLSLGGIPTGMSFPTTSDSSNLVIQRNGLNLHGTSTLRGISIVTAGASTLESIAITENVIDGMGVGAVTGIEVVVDSVGCSNISVSRNELIETGFDTNKAAIVVRDTVPFLNAYVNVSVDDNMIKGIIAASAGRSIGTLGGPAVYSGLAIYVAGCVDFSVSSNLVRWVDSLSAGQSIRVPSGARAKISNNTIHPSGSVIGNIFVDTTDALVIGNLLEAADVIDTTGVSGTLVKANNISA